MHPKHTTSQARIQTKCLICGTSFSITPYQARNGRGKYCSRTCLSLSQSRQVGRMCEQCHTSFTVRASRVKTGEARFCSRECRSAFERAVALQRHLRNWSIAELAYLAGLIDGEGSISIIKSLEHRNNAPPHLRYRLRLYVTNTNASVMEWLARTFGGGIRSRPKPSGAIVYQWTAPDLAIEAILQAAQRFFIVKSQQVAVALRFRENFVHRLGGNTRDNKRVIAPEQLVMRESLWKEMAKLNSLGGKTRKGPRRGYLVSGSA